MDGTAVFFILFGLAFLGLGVWMIRLRHEVAAWPSVVGRMTKRELIWQWSTTSVNQGGRHKQYTPSVRYSYTVDGTEHVSDQVELGGTSWGSKRSAEKRLASFPDDVPVRYDPRDPARSCLQGPSRSTAYLVSAVGAGCTVAGVVAAVV